MASAGRKHNGGVAVPDWVSEALECPVCLETIKAGFLIRHFADLSRISENPVFSVRLFLSSVGSKLWLSYIDCRAQIDTNIWHR